VWNGIALAQSGEDRFVVGAMGDSITRAFDTGRPLDNPALSWATGDDVFGRVESHLVRLKQMHGKKTAGYNVARSGGKAIEIPGQAAKLAPHKPDYVTILIGANDLCDWPDDAQRELEDLQQNVRSGIERLIAANPNVLIALSPVPDMYNLWEIGHGNSCQAKWNLLNFCSRLLSPSATAAGREALVEQWYEVNAAYAGIAEEFPLNVRFAAAGADVKFEKEHISAIDCFHPSIEGQNLLSEIVWEAVAPDLESLVRSP